MYNFAVFGSLVCIYHGLWSVILYVALRMNFELWVNCDSDVKLHSGTVISLLGLEAGNGKYHPFAAADMF